MADEHNNIPVKNENGSGSNPNRVLVAEEAVTLLSTDDISKAINTFKADTPEKEIALEFVKSHYQFMQELVKNDLERKLGRTDFEIKDLVAHVNIMMKNKDEYIFTTMVIHSPSHYHLVQQQIIKQQGEKNREE